MEDFREKRLGQAKVVVFERAETRWRMPGAFCEIALRQHLIPERRTRVDPSTGAGFTVSDHQSEERGYEEKNLLEALVTVGSFFIVPGILAVGIHKNVHKFTDAVSVSHSDSFELKLLPQDAIQLFTAKGETAWIPGWNPSLLKGDGYEKGSVFAISHGKHSTFIPIDYDEEKKHALYAKVTQGISADSIEINVGSNKRVGSIVTVDWERTALSDRGNEEVSKFDSKAYRQMMAEWKTMIESSGVGISEFLEGRKNQRRSSQCNCMARVYDRTGLNMSVGHLLPFRWG